VIDNSRAALSWTNDGEEEKEKGLVYRYKVMIMLGRVSREERRKAGERENESYRRWMLYSTF
jgi:hypothetical protein